MTQDLIKQLLSELIKLTVSGIIGGVVGSVLGLKAFQSQKRSETRHDDLIRKRDALRDILIMLPWIDRDMTVGWENPVDEDETPRKHVMNLRNKFHQVQAIFLKDQQVWDSMEKLDFMVGVSSESYYKFNKEYPNETIDTIGKIIKEKILEIEKEIS
jgi:hypothetical protein